MSKITDAGPRVNQDVAGEHASKAAEVLAVVAGDLAMNEPGEVVDEIEFAVLVGAKAYEQAGRSITGGGQNVSRLALRAVGAVPAGVTREVFAVTVAQAAQRLGYDWTADDHRRVIPSIPAPRKPKAGAR